MEAYDVFLSYSRKDQALVQRLRDLLSLSGRRVFWDAVSITPGQAWATELENALRNSDLVVLLWCCDTAQSKWVKREIRLARKSGKNIVPVLLCAFPPPPSVRKLQWIDLSNFVRHACSHRRPVPKEDREDYERRRKDSVFEAYYSIPRRGEELDSNTIFREARTLQEDQRPAFLSAFLRHSTRYAGLSATSIESLSTILAELSARS